jgi:hypothetical protein
LWQILQLLLKKPIPHILRLDFLNLWRNRGALAFPQMRVLESELEHCCVSQFAWHGSVVWLVAAIVPFCEISLD